MFISFSYTTVCFFAYSQKPFSYKRFSSHSVTPYILMEFVKNSAIKPVIRCAVGYNHKLAQSSASLKTTQN